MLLELTIQNFAIIDRLTVRWARGLNVITGETGAGKSILVDAVGVLMGERLGPDLIRTGAERAVVEGVFALDFSGPQTEHEAESPSGPLASILREAGIDFSDGTLIISREVSRTTGRTITRINGRAIATSLLQQVGQHLVDIHGQSQHLSLLRTREQLELLDRYAGLTGEVALLGNMVRDLRAVRQELQHLREEQRRSVREMDLLRHEIREIEAACLQVGEEEELVRVRSRLRNVERLRMLAVQVLEALAGQEDVPGAEELLGNAVRYCTELARVDPSLEEDAAALEQASALVSESVRRMRSYLEGVEEDPQALERIEDRLLTLADLKRKYGGSIAEVLGYLEEARRRVQRVERFDQICEELAARESGLCAQVAALAASVSAKRRDAARKLVSEVEAELADLGMKGAVLRMRFSYDDDPDGLPIDGDGGERRVAFDQSGVDRVEFLISPNPGEAPRPLAKIASGGELARVALALKTALCHADPRPVLIFDEIDVGVGGRSAGVIGQKLWSLTRQHQVLCVTHLPQVACYADLHLVASKVVHADRTHTQVREAGADARIAELAAMLSGPSPTSAAEANARELLRQSEEWKRRTLPPADMVAQDQPSSPPRLF